jgi:hypothetical protein
MHIWISGPKLLLTLRCLAKHPVSMLKACIKFPLKHQSSEASKHEQINMRRYVINQSQGSAEVQCNFAAVAGVAENKEFRLEKIEIFSHYHSLNSARGAQDYRSGHTKW